MAAPGFTPIIIYHSNTAAAVPSTGNLTNGEIAINITDKKIYTKSFAGALVTLMDTMGSQSASAVAITGGNINGTVIGGTTPAAGTFSTATINGGNINGTVIGASTPAAATFSTVTITAGTINGTPIGGSTPAAGAFTTVNGTTLTMTLDSAFNSTGALKIPVGTTAQQPTGADGKIRYNTNTTKYEGYANGAWSSLGGGATGGGSDEIFIENKQTVTTNYTIPTGKSAMSTGPITINSGITVTVPAGSRWVVL